MTTQNTTTAQRHAGIHTNDSASSVTTTYWKTATCVVLSMFYFAMLAYPFGVSGEGYVLNKALIAAVIFFAISIPAWIINIKREFLSPDQEATNTEEDSNEHACLKVGQLAMNKSWLSPEEIKQILFCQTGNGKKFGEIAVQRNYLSLAQVNSLLAMQRG